MSDEEDTTTNPPQHRADAPVDGGDQAPATTNAESEKEAVDGRTEHSLADLGGDASHPFDQTNGIVEGLQGDSDTAEEAQDSETQGG